MDAALDTGFTHSPTLDPTSRGLKPGTNPTFTNFDPHPAYCIDSVIEPLTERSTCHARPMIFDTSRSSEEAENGVEFYSDKMVCLSSKRENLKCKIRRNITKLKAKLSERVKKAAAVEQMAFHNTCSKVKRGAYRKLRQCFPMIRHRSPRLEHC